MLIPANLLNRDHTLRYFKILYPYKKCCLRSEENCQLSYSYSFINKIITTFSYANLLQNVLNT